MRPRPDEAEVRRAAAALAAFWITARRGVESFDSPSLLRGLDEACRAVGVPEDQFDACAELLDFFYHRAWDCYLGRKQLAEARASDEKFRAPRYYGAA